MRLLLTVSITIAGFAACQAPQEDKSRKRIDEIVRFRVEQKEFSGAVLIAKGDDIVFNKSYGLANIEWNIPNTTTTRFRLGSITKQFTAAAILLLEEEGKLKLEDPVRTHWPDAPRAWDKVTIFHLLTHTSGMPPPDETWRFSEGPAEETVGHFRNKPLEFEPGAQFRYSNSGFIVLAYLIERISGMSYGGFLQERILKPLGMKDSGVESNGPIVANRASGYADGDDGFVNASYLSMPSSIGSGALYSTTEDLLRWTRGLFGGKLLKAASLERMVSPFKENYALGLYVSNEKSIKVIQHGGSIQGFNAMLAYYPDEQMTLVVLANIEGTADGLARRLSGFMHGDTVVLPFEKREIKLPEERLKKLAGIYELTPDANMVITFSNGALTARLGTQTPGKILAETPNRFFAADVDGEIEFEEDSSGVVTLVLRQDGGEGRAKRLPDRTEVKLPDEVLRRHAGVYQFEVAPDAEVVVTLEAGRLQVKPPNDPKQELYPESETRFFFKTFNAEVEFVRNPAGQTTGIVFRDLQKVLKATRRPAVGQGVN
jgi:CubicO group peptidase (beta-lactamase class C family)